MGAFAVGFGLILLIATARTDEAPKGPKVTHKVSIVVRLLSDNLSRHVSYNVTVFYKVHYALLVGDLSR